VTGYPSSKCLEHWHTLPVGSSSRTRREWHMSLLLPQAMHAKMIRPDHQPLLQTSANGLIHQLPQFQPSLCPGSQIINNKHKCFTTSTATLQKLLVWTLVSVGEMCQIQKNTRFSRWLTQVWLTHNVAKLGWHQVQGWGQGKSQG
jgi:hypothetical protein